MLKIAIHLSIALVLSALQTSDVFGVDYPDSSLVRNIVKVQELLYNDHFVEADSATQELIERYPNDPSGNLFRAIGLLMEMCDSEENSRCELFQAHIDSTFSKTKRVLDTSSTVVCAWMHLYRGHAHAYRSLWEAQFGSTIAAIKGSRAAKAEYERGLKADSTVYDLYFGLGLYHYWKSAKAGLLRWFGIINNDKEKGIAQLLLAVDSSLISREAARSALIWIWLDRNQFDSAIAVAESMRGEHPDGKSFLWPLAKAYWKLEQYNNAADVYNYLRILLEKNPGNYFNMVDCDYWLYRCYNRLCQEDKARHIAQRFSLYVKEIPRETKNRQRNKISYLKKKAR
ncbi:MAG: hypothetical protein DRP47_10740 [Candidatus Zixiibacteriota bacterium]|nr:MAG: hypothetical protein DRP47_10740 [candidate division Zixibacteria bacterium]